MLDKETSIILHPEWNSDFKSVRVINTGALMVQWSGLSAILFGLAKASGGRGNKKFKSRKLELQSNHFMQTKNEKGVLVNEDLLFKQKKKMSGKYVEHVILRH